MGKLVFNICSLMEVKVVIIIKFSVILVIFFCKLWIIKVFKFNFFMISWIIIFLIKVMGNRGMVLVNLKFVFF